MENKEINLTKWLLMGDSESLQKLENPPSLADGLSKELEKELRYLGCELIQQGAILLKLPQTAAATGQILFQRFYYQRSFVRYNFEHVVMGCLLLASKIEEEPRRCRDVLNSYCRLKQIHNNRDYGTPDKKLHHMVLDQNYLNMKLLVIKAERRILNVLGFVVHVDHPHKLIYVYLHSLFLLDNKEMLQKAWSYMNDGLRTDLFLRHRPETIACACIHLASKTIELPVILPANPRPWFELFDVNAADVSAICQVLQKLFMKTQAPRLAELSAQVEELYKKVVGIFEEKVQKEEKSANEKKHREHKDGECRKSREEGLRRKRADPEESSGQKSDRKTSSDHPVNHHNDGTKNKDRHKKSKHASKKHRKRDRSNHGKRSEESDAQPQFSRKRLRHSSVPRQPPKSLENMVSSIRYGHTCFRNNSASDSSLSNNDSPLPSSMKLADVGVISDRSLHCFSSNRSFLSSRFMRDPLMEIDERKYASVEQFYMYYKAKVFGDMQAAKRVMLAAAPGALKKLGFSIANFDPLKWRNVAIQVMVIGTLRKFEQNSDLRDQLLGTTYSILVKATCADNFWGAGFTKDTLIDADPGAWLGQNVLGRILMMVRERLIKEGRKCKSG